MEPEILAAELRPSASEPPPGTALRPGTVIEDSFVTTSMIVRIDGDTDPVPVQSLVGGLMVNTRVMVLFFPPQGAYIIGVIAEAPWKPVTVFGTNWSNFGGGAEVVEYRRDGNWVTVRGVATRSAGAAASIFTLPTGYRPRAGENFPVDSNAQAHSVVVPTAAGTMLFTAGAAAAATGYVSLSGIRFRVA